MLFKIEAPLRIDFCGGYTDIPEIHKVTGMAIANLAIDLYKDYFRKQKVIFCISNKKNYHNMRLHELNLLNLLENHFSNSFSFNYSNKLTIENEIPVSTGLGSSSALSAMLITAYFVNIGLEINNIRNKIFQEALNFERNTMNIIGGFQDYISAIFGGYNYITGLCDSVEDKNIYHTKIHNLLEDYINTSVFIIYSPRTYNSSIIIKNIIHQLLTSNNRLILENIMEIKNSNIDFNKILLSIHPNIISNLNKLFDKINKSWEHQKKLSGFIKNNALSIVEDELKEEACAIHGIGAGGGTIAIYGREDKSELINEKIKILTNKLKIKCFYPKVNNFGIKCKFL